MTLPGRPRESNDLRVGAQGVGYVDQLLTHGAKCIARNHGGVFQPQHVVSARCEVDSNIVIVRRLDPQNVRDVIIRLVSRLENVEAWRFHNSLPHATPPLGHRAPVWNNGKFFRHGTYSALRECGILASRHVQLIDEFLIGPQGLQRDTGARFPRCNWIQMLGRPSLSPQEPSRRAASTRPNGRSRATLSNSSREYMGHRLIPALGTSAVRCNDMQCGTSQATDVTGRRDGQPFSIRRPVVHVSLRKGDSPSVRLGSRVVEASPCRHPSRRLTARAVPTWQRPAPLSLREVRG